MNSADGQEEATPGILDQMTSVSTAVFKTLIAASFVCAVIARLLKQNVYLIKRQHSVSNDQSLSTQDLEGGRGKGHLSTHRALCRGAESKGQRSDSPEAFRI